MTFSKTVIRLLILHWMFVMSQPFLTLLQLCWSTLLPSILWSTESLTTKMSSIVFIADHAMYNRGISINLIVTRIIPKEKHIELYFELVILMLKTQVQFLWGGGLIMTSQYAKDRSLHWSEGLKGHIITRIKLPLNRNHHWMHSHMRCVMEVRYNSMLQMAIGALQL